MQRGRCSSRCPESSWKELAFEAGIRAEMCCLAKRPQSIKPTYERRFDMFQKTSSRVVLACVVLVIPIVFGLALKLYAGRQVSVEPGDLVLKGGKIVGVMTAEFGLGGNSEPGLVNVRIVGSLYKPSGTVQVALDLIADYDIPGTTEQGFLTTTKQHVENWELEGIGPPDVFSESGGETLIITRVSEVFVAKPTSGPAVLGAIITIRARA